ncbi:unnamed protein product, partial [Porites lobata]
MTTYFEYGVKLTNGQKSKLASAIRNKSPLTLRLKHSHLQGSDELMLTQRQITKIKKSLRNGTGSDIKISKTQIRKSVKHGGNFFSSLASIGAKVLPYAIKGISKAVPALATGAATALGEIGLNKIFGKGITIPKKFFPMLPAIRGESTKSQIDLINKIYQSGGRLVIKPTRKQIEGGFLGTLASIGIPMAISLVSKMFGGGLQVDRRGSSNTANVYVPHPPPKIEMGQYGTSELMRNKNFQKKSVNYGINKLTPFIQDSVGSAMDKLSTKVRPKKKYKTNRPELDGRGIDIHNAILKVAPKKGLVIPGHNYTGPGNPLHDQLRHDDEGNILEIYQQPTGPTDAVSMQHDVDYAVCGNKPKNEQ